MLFADWFIHFHVLNYHEKVKKLEIGGNSWIRYGVLITSFLCVTDGRVVLHDVYENDIVHFLSVIKPISNLDLNHQ